MKAITPPLRRALFLSSLTLLAACSAPQVVPPPPAPPAAAPPPAPPPQLPKPPADWRDAPQTGGTWRWSLDAGRSTASFVGGNGNLLASLSCDRANARVLLGRRGDASASVPMALTSTFGTRPLTSDPLRSPPHWVVAELHSGDPMLDSIAFSRGRFALEVAGLETLYLPSWPEISRVIEDCR